VQRDHIDTADKTVTQQNAQLVAAGQQQVLTACLALIPSRVSKMFIHAPALTRADTSRLRDASTNTNTPTHHA
jgi:hypothetical protein